MAKTLVEEITKLDEAVDLMAARLKARLRETAARGRRGWDDPDDCPLQRLCSEFLYRADDILYKIEHNDLVAAEIETVDAMAFAMFIFERLRKGNADAG